MSAYSFPKLCELKLNNDINEELNGIIRIAVFLIVPIMFLLIVAREPIIKILYNSEFLQAADYMPVQIIGDFFKILAWAFGMYLLPAKRLITFIWLNLLQDFILIGLAFLLVERYGLYGIAASFSISYIVTFAAYYACAKLQIGFSIWNKNSRLLLISFVGLLFITISEICLESGLNYIFFTFVSLIWCLVSIQKEEFMAFREYLSSKLATNLKSF
jgi:O-antigen/teichoic acid export membrane protein